MVVSHAWLPFIEPISSAVGVLVSIVAITTTAIFARQQVRLAAQQAEGERHRQMVIAGCLAYEFLLYIAETQVILQRLEAACDTALQSAVEPSENTEGVVIRIVATAFKVNDYLKANQRRFADLGPAGGIAMMQVIRTGEILERETNALERHDLLLVSRIESIRVRAQKAIVAVTTATERLKRIADQMRTKVPRS